MKLLADGGSTKVDWLMTDEDGNVSRYTSVGINPTILTETTIERELLSVAEQWPLIKEATEVEFYGAGCTPIAVPKMQKCLAQILNKAESIIVGSDIIGAAKALLNDKEGIACILGTGACSCLWGQTGDGMGIVAQTPALGYILGDEGSGAVLGKMMINAMYKGVLPAEIREDFEQEYGVDMYGVIENVYRKSAANRWLASISPFVMKHMDNELVELIVKDNLRAFFIRNILPYQRPDLEVSFVGSVAFYYEEQLRSVAEESGIRIGKVQASPLA